LSGSPLQNDGPASDQQPRQESPVIGESPQTIALQLQQLVEGARKVVIFPDGQGMPAHIPPGVALASGQSWIDENGQIHRNLYLFRPDLTDRSAIKRAERTNALAELLGGTVDMGGPDKTALQGPPVAVIGRSPDGTEAQTTAAVRQALPQTVIAMHAVTLEGGAIKTPEQALENMESQSPTPEQTRRSSIADPLMLKDQVTHALNLPSDQTARCLNPNKRKNKRSNQNWIYWLLVLPFACIGAIIGSLVTSLMIDWIPFSDWDIFKPYAAYASGAIASILCPAGFISAGAYIAPSARRSIAVLLAVGYMVFLVFVSSSISYSMGYRPVALIIASFSSVSSVAEVFRESREGRPVTVDQS
jgi:hypothetical protein